MNAKLFLALIASIVAINVAAMPSYDDVLVVVNNKSTQSLEIGEYFKNARNIPEINICHISVTDLQGGGEEAGHMSIADRNSAIAAIKKYLSDNSLAEKINYIILTRGIPYFSMNDPSGSTNYQLFDLKLLFDLSESAASSSIADIFNYNKYYYYMVNNYNNQNDYKFTQKKYGYYQVARLDGPGTVNIKKMIDSTGYPAYQSYKKPVKFLTVTPFFPAAVTAEIKSRGNIKIVSPDLKNGEDMRDVGQDIMFGYLNRVDFAIPAISATTEYLAPYYASVFYSDSEVHSYYPSVYTGLSFLPGSMITCFRSFPAMYNHRQLGGMFKFDTALSKAIDYKKSDGSDIKFRHMSCIAYDPVNNWIWCGTGDNQLKVFKGFSDTNVSDQTANKYEARRGGGIAIFDTNGNILNHFTQDNSPLTNNRVTKIAYDKYSNRMWVAHYGGIQYYDLVNKTWSDIAALKNNFAASCGIYVDPYDTDKVYFSFYYSALSLKTKNCSLLPNADMNFFEYSKSVNTVKSYLIENGLRGIIPQIAKTSADTLWVTKHVYLLYKYDLKNSKVVEKIDISSKIPEIAALAAGDTYVITAPSAITAIPGTKMVLVATSCRYKYKNPPDGKTYVVKRYVLRITDNGAAASTIELINSDAMNIGGGSLPYNTIWSLIADPLNPDKLYMSSSDFTNVTPAALLKSADQGKTWTPQTIPAWMIVNLREITMDANGNIYGTRGYELNQQNLSDFQAFGLCAWGGGLSHDNFTYNPTPAAAPAGGTVVGGIYSSDTSAENEAYSMMFMLLDGYYTGEARFAVFKQYPRDGGGGYVAHMLCFEPKCAPYAPRVDEENLNPMIADKKTIEIPLRSHGLPLAMDGFMAATINSGTVVIKDEFGKPVTAAVEYKAVGNKIVLTGDFSGNSYNVTLKCGTDGIKNIKGASLTNTRANEFKDEITWLFLILSG